MILGAILSGIVDGMFKTSKPRKRTYGTRRKSYVPKGKNYRVYCRGK